MGLYLLMGSIFPKGDYHQFLHLANLDQHFRLHVRDATRTEENVSFLDFLQMHYFNTQIHHGNHGQDHKDLPLHQFSPSLNHMVPLVWAMVNLAAPTSLPQLPVSASSLRHSEYPASIFHPPILYQDRLTVG